MAQVFRNPAERLEGALQPFHQDRHSRAQEEAQPMQSGVSSVTTYRQGTPASLAVMILAVGAGFRAPSASRPRWRYRGMAG